MNGISIDPICRYVYDNQKLMHDFPPRFLNPNKKIVYSIACPAGSSSSGQLGFSRWRAVPLPPSFIPENSGTKVEARMDVFAYEPPPKGTSTVEWYLNFADPDLFCAYGGALLSQDELQVAEHPSLGSVREALLGTRIALRTVENGEPTPILITGVERRCAMATEPNPTFGRPRGLYGNNCASANREVIKQAVRVIRPPTMTNLIAMAALSSGRGPYTSSQIGYILRTAVTGFSAAKIESKSVQPQNSILVVHSGFWGCGAFGGNRTLMALLQILAAHLSGVDRLVFHTFNKTGSKSLSNALKIFERILLPGRKEIAVGDLLAVIEGMKFQWGVGDGT